MRKLLVILLMLSFGVSLAAEQHKPHGPIIVAKRSFIGQTGDMAPTTIFKVRKDGLYRVSLYETNKTYAQPYLTLIWTDEYGPKIMGGGISAFPQIALDTVGAVNTGQVIVHCLAGTEIQFTSTAYGQATYNVYVTVEML